MTSFPGTVIGIGNGAGPATIAGNGNGGGNGNGTESSAHEPRDSVNSGSTVTDSCSQSRLRPPRSIPPWITSYEEGQGDQHELLSPPPASKPAQHNNAPYEPRTKRRASRDGYIDWSVEPPTEEHDDPKKRKKSRKVQARGRKWDHLRTAEPVIITGYSQDPLSRWKDFMTSSQYGRMENEESTVVEPAYLDQLQPEFNKPFIMPQPSEKPKQRMTAAKLWRMMVRHPLVPLGFRLIVFVTSIIALAISVKIFQLENRRPEGSSAERTQSLVAIVVDCVAVPYIGYMTWDEYTGLPLGLRSASQKASLVLMDLFFIIFKASSTALSFEALVFHNSNSVASLQASRALASFMLVGLVSWSLSFTVNVFRLVYKLDTSEEEMAGGRLKMKSLESGFS